MAKSKIDFCLFCGRDATVDAVEQDETLNVRGEQITVRVRFYHCQVCGEEFDVSDPDHDHLADAYAEYERRTGVPISPRSEYPGV